MHSYSAEAPTVLVDMDGVLADFDQEIINRITERYPHIPIAERQNFYIAADYPQYTEQVRALSREEGFFASLPLMDGALEGWQRIIDYGYTPRICSSPIGSNPFSKPEKLGWLETHFVPVFGGWVVDQAIITDHKEDYAAIALIDDREVLKNADQAVWQHIIFDRPFNRGCQQPRLHGWRDANLLRLLQAAEARPH